MIAQQENAAHYLRAEHVSLAYDQGNLIVHDATVNIQPGSFTVIVGPNGCGKSTLLRSLARLLKPVDGQVSLDGTSLEDFHTKHLAQLIALLPQSSTAPEGISVEELVMRGRFPHQGLFGHVSETDRVAVTTAMRATATEKLARHSVVELSGGQRQRVWVAMALAQETPILLLDEPTTFLDIANQVDLLDLLASLNHQGRTIVAVLHDLNLAARYATQMIAMADGRLVAEGTPHEVMTAMTMRTVFDLEVTMMEDPITGTPLMLPGAPAGLRTPGSAYRSSSS